MDTARALLVVTATFLACRRQSAVQHPLTTTPRVPPYTQYAVDTSFRGPPRVSLADNSARHFRTVLTRGAAEGPNFAGHYRMVQWGCGSPCHDGAIIDLESGAVFFMPHAEPQAWAYRRDSRLLVANASDQCFDTTAADVPEYSVWSEWTGHDLRPVDSTRIVAPCGR